MKKGVVILLLIIGLACLFFQNRVVGANGVYLKTLGIILVMFCVYKISIKVTSKKGEDSDQFKF